MAAEVPAPPGGLAGGGMFSQFPLIGVDKVLKRTLMGAIVVGVVGSAVAILVGYPLVAPGLILGLILALINHRVFQSSALHFTSSEGKVRRKPFAGSVFLRLGACTVIAIVLVIYAEPVGWGTIAGLAIFQALMLVNAIVALIGYQRSDGSDVSA
jgi:dipeptide/tripeptide permease